MDVVQPDGFLLVMTAKGFGKRTPIKDYSVQGRNTKGVSTLGRDPKKGGIIAAARVVNEDDDVTIISGNGMVLRSRVANLPKSKRTSKETAIMTLKEGDGVASIARLEAKVESKKEKGKSDSGEAQQLELIEGEGKKAMSRGSKKAKGKSEK